MASAARAALSMDGVSWEDRETGADFLLAQGLEPVLPAGCNRSDRLSDLAARIGARRCVSNWQACGQGWGATQRPGLSAPDTLPEPELAFQAMRSTGAASAARAARA